MISEKNLTEFTERFIEGSLTNRELDELKSSLPTSDFDDLLEEARLVALMKNSPKPQPPSRLKETVLRELENSNTFQRETFNTWKILPLAAALFIMAGIGVVFQMERSTPSITAPSVTTSPQALPHASIDGDLDISVFSGSDLFENYLILNLHINNAMAIRKLADGSFEATFPSPEDYQNFMSDIEDRANLDSEVEELESGSLKAIMNVRQ